MDNGPNAQPPTGSPKVSETMDSVSAGHTQPQLGAAHEGKEPASRNAGEADQRQPGNDRGQKRGRGREDGTHKESRRKKKRETGRAEWSRNNDVDRRARNEAERLARAQKTEQSGQSFSPFSKEEIASEERRPKRKVAVMIGYCGSGYKGMQLNANEKTIEGDLFSAFVAAGAISKANADDPKKSSFVRCARTDKGVHAAGNIISLKLIVEDADIVKRINENLPPQVRVWGIERTNAAFSCYQLCDSRIYEYLIPSYCFLPPHPRSSLGRATVQVAREKCDLEGYESRQEEVLDFWQSVEKDYVEPILASLDEEARSSIISSLERKNPLSRPADGERFVPHPALTEIKAVYLRAKRAYRISSRRLQRIRDALSYYIGTCNFHNYTISKGFRDPSAKRVIKSFTVSDTSPFIVQDTEWLSLRVHGQSFMMHQIRKMVAMAALCVRTGCPLERILESYGPADISIPKAPGLGLLLERPVFDNYNERAIKDFQREKIDFGKYEKEINGFKQREIYELIHREEKNASTFDLFFGNIDNFNSEVFHYLTSAGIASDLSKASASNFKADRLEQLEAEIESESEEAIVGKVGEKLEEG